MRGWYLAGSALAAACGRFGFDSPGDAGGDLDDAAVDAACDPCPMLPGPLGVPIERNGTCYCIDSTEVTQRQYQTFITAGAPPAGIAECSWKTSFVPSNGTLVPWPPAAGTLEHPVVGVDWCDAATYCAWAGKRLCGKIGGGPTSFTTATDPDESQWYRVCSKAGTQAFPYGATYAPSACWGDQPSPGPVVDVASHPGCEGSYPGVFDLSGNVNEWEDACDARTGPSDRCYARGGGKYYQSDRLICKLLEGRLRDGRNTDVGFRCCGS